MEKELLNDLKEIIKKSIDKNKSILGHPIESKKVILYSGNPKAKILVLGRDLGADEVEQEEVLIGRAGQLFRKEATKIGFNPNKDFLMTNTVPLRPTNNKAFPKHARLYFRPIIMEILRQFKIKFTLCLGNESLQTFFPDADGITKEAGIWKQWRLHTPKFIRVMPCAHPSYIARGVDKREKFTKFSIPIKRLYKAWINKEYL